MTTAEILVMLFGSSGLIISLATMVKELIEKKLDNSSTTEEEKKEMIKDLLQMSCRTDLYQMWQMCRTKKYRTQEDTDRFSEFYQIYKVKYEGNSYAQQIYGYFMALPQKEDDEIE